MNKVIAVIKTPDYPRPFMTVYDDMKDYLAEPWSPETEILAVYDTTPKGKTYTEKKASIRDLAIETTSAWDDCEFDSSWYVLGELGEIFSRLGKRFGLLREFHENGIC